MTGFFIASGCAHCAWLRFWSMPCCVSLRALLCIYLRLIASRRALLRLVASYCVSPRLIASRRVILRLAPSYCVSLRLIAVSRRVLLRLAASRRACCACCVSPRLAASYRGQALWLLERIGAGAAGRYRAAAGRNRCRYSAAAGRRRRASC